MLNRRRTAALMVAVIVGLVPEVWTAASALVPDFPASIRVAALHRDFGVFWTAGALLRQGAINTIFHPAAFQAWLQHQFPFSRGVRLWSYPPSMLFLIAPLGWLPPLAAWCCWMIAGAAALLGALRLAVPGEKFWAATLLVIVTPVFWDNILVGQNAAFTGALTIIGFALLDRRPTRAGIGFGLLTIKPQLGLLIPLAVLASARWRALFTAIVTALALAGLAALLFPHSWALFFANVAPAMNHRLLRAYIPTPSQSYMASAFIGVEGLRLPHSVAWFVQAIVSILAAGAMVALWRRPVSDPLARQRRNAASAALCLAATPFTLDYDAVGATALLAGLIVSQGNLLTRERFEIALIAIAQPGWSLILGLAFHTPAFPWIAWLAFGCLEAFRPAPVPDQDAPDQGARAMSIGVGR